MEQLALDSMELQDHKGHKDRRAALLVQPVLVDHKDHAARKDHKGQSDYKDQQVQLDHKAHVDHKDPLD
jgi:hypothetical protein